MGYGDATSHTFVSRSRLTSKISSPFEQCLIRGPGPTGRLHFSFGGLAIIRRATCLFMMMMLFHYANQFEDDATDGCGQGR